MSVKTINIRKSVYSMASSDGNEAEIIMYGDIYEQRPVDWWTGEEVPGNFITLNEFMEDLDKISKCKKITVRMNSYGGDAGVSNTIHNRLRELARNGAETICIVDGVAMSGGSLIMCACDTVKVNPSSLIMIHKCWSLLWGGYNADELRVLAEQQEAWDNMQAMIYKRKTGLSMDEIKSMMSETTYMTGGEAVNKGFADELLEDAEPVKMSASADGRSIIVGSHQMHLAPGMIVPDNIPTVKSAEKAVDNTTQDNPVNEGGNSMDLKSANSANSTPSGTADAPECSISEAVQAERNRIKEIDAIAGLFDAELVESAKYGESPCSAQELAYRAAQRAQQNGKTFLANLSSDAESSGASAVGAAPGAFNDASSTEELSSEQKLQNARTEIKSIFGKKE